MQMSPLVTLILSIAFGAAALVGARLWLGGGKDVEVAAPTEPIVETAPVLVAVREIPRGVKIDPAWFEIEDRPAARIPRGAFASTDALLETGDARRTLVTVFAGETLAEDMLLAPGMRASLSAKIEPGFRAFSIRTTDVSGVAGFVLPGDRVDVIFTEDSSPESKTLKLVSKVLLQNVEVLGVDLNDDMTGEDASVFKTATLAVTLDQAQQLSVATQTGTLSFALRGSADEEFLQADAVTLGDKPEVRRQVAYVPRPAALKARGPSSSTVEVVLGEQVSTHTVPVSQ